MPTTDHKLHVFLCHADQDHPAVLELYDKLQNEAWIKLWIDDYEVLLGQNRDLEIKKAVEKADVVIVCLSTTSVNKDGEVHKDLRRVLDMAQNKPEGEIFIIPVKLDDVNLPPSLERYQPGNYFGETKSVALQLLLKSLQQRAKKIESAPKKNPVLDSKRDTSSPAVPPLAPATSPSTTNFTAPVKKKLDPAILVALIGVGGTLLAAMITAIVPVIIARISTTPISTSTQAPLLSTVTPVLNNNPVLTETPFLFTDTPETGLPSAADTEAPPAIQPTLSPATGGGNCAIDIHYVQADTTLRKKVESLQSRLESAGYDVTSMSASVSASKFPQFFQQNGYFYGNLDCLATARAIQSQLSDLVSSAVSETRYPAGNSLYEKNNISIYIVDNKFFTP